MPGGPRLKHLNPDYSSSTRHLAAQLWNVAQEQDRRVSVHLPTQGIIAIVFFHNRSRVQQKDMDQDATLDMDLEDIWALFFFTAAPKMGLAMHMRICRLMSPSVPFCWCLSRFSSDLHLEIHRENNHRYAAWLTGEPQERKSDGIAPLRPWRHGRFTPSGEPRGDAPPAGRQASACCVSLKYVCCVGPRS